MRRLYILLFCILFVGSIAKPCFSEEGKEIKVDGYAWDSFSYEAKIGWVIGFLQGLVQVNEEAHLFLIMCEKTTKLGYKKVVDESTEVADKLRFVLWDKILFPVGNCDQLVAGLDEFYKDYRNKKILIKGSNPYS